MFKWFRKKIASGAEKVPSFALDRIEPRIKQILSIKFDTEESRTAHADFVYRTLHDMETDIIKLSEAAGDYPNGIISGDVWMTGAAYASHAEALTHHFGHSAWLKHEANAAGLWVRATLAVCSHYHHLVGPAMNASASCSRRQGDVETAAQMWSGVVKDFAFLLDDYDEEPDGPNAEDRIAIKSLIDACIALKETGATTVDSYQLEQLTNNASTVLGRPEPPEDE